MTVITGVTLLSDICMAPLIVVILLIISHQNRKTNSPQLSANYE